MLVSIGSYDICDGTLAGGVAIGQARLQMDRVFDVTIPIAQINPVLFDRVCRKLTFTFTVQRTWSSSAAAETFALGVDYVVPSSGNVQLFPTASITPIYIPNGAIINHQTSYIGATTTTTYTIVGGQPSSSP